MAADDAPHVQLGAADGERVAHEVERAVGEHIAETRARHGGRHVAHGAHLGHHVVVRRGVAVAHLLADIGERQAQVMVVYVFEGHCFLGVKEL